MSVEDRAIAKVAILGDEVRARLFGFVRRSRRPVTRVEAAAEVGISAKLAAFHLDKLVGAGLLRVRDEMPGTVRKVGRTPKVYEAGGEVAVSIPGRRHELLAEILAEAVAAGDGVDDVRQAALDVATERGRAMGAHQRDMERPGRLGVERALSMACAQLDDAGFEPERAASDLVRLRNCPFHPLAARQPELVCGINHAFLSGYLSGLQAPPGASAVLAPAPDACCVELRGPGNAKPGDDAGSSGSVGCDASPTA